MEDQRYLFLVELNNGSKSLFIGRQWDFYSQFIVCCRTELEARNTHPSGRTIIAPFWHHDWIDYDLRHWDDKLYVTCIGVALETTDNGVIMAKMMS